MRWALLAIVFAVSCGGENTLSEDEYIERVDRDVFDRLNDTGYRVAGMWREVLDRPALVKNDEWRTNMITELNPLHDIHEDAESLNPPESMEDAHDAVLRATECYSDAANQIQDAINEDGDGDLDSGFTLILQCGDLERDASDAIDEAT